ncbi:MAG: transposase, partial [Gallionella sp.]
CVHGRKCLFGDVIENEMKVNELGWKVQAVWDDLPVHYPHVETDVFVVMPNHVHGVVVLRDVGAGFKPARTVARRHGLSEVVRGFKTFSARRINEFCKTSGAPVWQRNYYGHVIRDDEDYNRIAEYVSNNPQRWMEDSLHPLFE